MTRYELLKSNQNFVDLMLRNQIKPTEIKYLALYEEYCQMKASGEKVYYIANMMASKYGIKVRTVYDVMRRLDSSLVF